MPRYRRANQGNGCLWIIGLFVLLGIVGSEYVHVLALLLLLGGLVYLVVSFADRQRGNPLLSPTPTPGSCVYLLKAGPYYKIGKASRFDRRIRQIELQLPFPVEVVHTIATDRITEVEAYWHRRFKHKRANGEWFMLDERDVAEFRQYTTM